MSVHWAQRPVPPLFFEVAIFTILPLAVYMISFVIGLLVFMLLGENDIGWSIGVLIWLFLPTPMWIYLIWIKAVQFYTLKKTGRPIELKNMTIVMHRTIHLDVTYDVALQHCLDTFEQVKPELMKDRPELQTSNSPWKTKDGYDANVFFRCSNDPEGGCGVWVIAYAPSGLFPSEFVSCFDALDVLPDEIKNRKIGPKRKKKDKPMKPSYLEDRS